MSSKAVQIISATAALALAAAALPSNALQTPTPASSVPAPSAALIEQAKQDGLTVEQERYIQSLPKTPSYHWDGYSDKPVVATLGPNKFMFPMNLYFDQIGPDFQGGVTLGLYWPDFKPLPPGERRSKHYFEHHQNKLIDITVDYVDRRPIDTLLLDQISEGPNKFYEPDKDDPRAYRSLRIKGEALYGFTPYFTDAPKPLKYLNKDGSKLTKESLGSNADDWYLGYGIDGKLNTVISCTPNDVPGTTIEDGNLVAPPFGEDQGMCKHSFVISQYDLDIEVSYLRAFLKDWKTFENRIRSVFDKYHTPRYSSANLWRSPHVCHTA